MSFFTDLVEEDLAASGAGPGTFAPPPPFEEDEREEDEPGSFFVDLVREDLAAPEPVPTPTPGPVPNDRYEGADLRSLDALPPGPAPVAATGDDLTFGQKLGNVRDQLVQGVATGVAAFPKAAALAREGLGRAMPGEYKGPSAADTDLFRTGEDLERMAKNLYPGRPELQESFILSKLPNAAGQFLPVLATAGGGGVVSGGAQGRPARRSSITPIHQGGGCPPRRMRRGDRK